MRLAGHLCKSRCQEILSGDYTFAKSLATKGFGRLQVNATAANGVVVDPSRIDEYVSNIRACMAAVPEIEWIIQANDETKPIWERLVTPTAGAGTGTGSSSTLTLAVPSNMSVLFDASCGKGELASSYPEPLTISTTTSSNVVDSAVPVETPRSAVGANTSGSVISVPTGYAGGMGPKTIHSVLTALRDATNGTRVWVDMESRLRTLTVASPGAEPVDIFDINKCFECVQVGLQFGLPVSKFSLLSV